MKKYKEIATLQYMGSKSRILSHICEPIATNNSIETVVDLFAGTGSVGYALKDYKKVISNDIEHYSFVINQAILNGCSFSAAEEKEFFNAVHTCYSRLTTEVKNAIAAENSFLINEPDYKEYQSFCENTPSVFTSDVCDPRLVEISNLVKLVTPGTFPDLDFPCLFLTYYANAYFGITQCCQIDAIRQSINTVKSADAQHVLLTVLMSVMSSTASTTTHFAQFLKVNSNATCKNLIEKRKFDIIQGFEALLCEYRQAGLCDKGINANNALCLNMDFAQCLNCIELSPQTLVYADPPYFKEHYSRYYHILNTVCLYDYPSMSVNPQTHELSIGRYRENRIVSDFGKKAKALGAFSELITKCADADAWLMISYSDNSIVAIRDLQELAEQRYDVLIEKIELNHSKQGRSSTAKVDEYIFICRPKSIVQDVDEKLAVIKEIKPIVDNPAGFMHNYMARKPYNVVSELIKRFCPENGCVYDPMFGSGTTLIEASKLGRSIVGTDINLLAYKLCRVSLTKWNLHRVFTLIETFCKEVEVACEDIYSFVDQNESRILERCHFDQINGKLHPTSYWYKVLQNGRLSGRRKSVASESFVVDYDSLSQYIPSFVTNEKLVPNSRIAIGANDTVHMYFCNRNLIAIDRIIQKLRNYQNEYGYPVLELIVSSAINLIKLSDKKASSQMPYWIPKRNVTSRNAVTIINQKSKAFKEGLEYLQENCKCFMDDSGYSANVQLANTPAQWVSSEILPNNSIDLVLTDPPYTDQVPYMEYSQLWYKVMGWDGFSDDTLLSELVVSDAPSRDKKIDDFNAIFAAIISRIVPALKENGYFIMFYHSFDLTSWSHILSLMESYGLMYCGQIPSAAPRKSFKTVMTPKGTLDGNYIVVFQKKAVRESVQFDGTVEDAKALAVTCAQKIISEHTEVTSQDLYDCGMLKDSFELGYLPVLAKKYATFVDVIAGEFTFSEGLWREK